MLRGLTIRDVVLIDRLSLAFRPGLCVLTGETGAGKSILLDALGLALGRRADAGLVRPGAEQAAVAAEFFVEPDHPAMAILREAGMSADLAGTIVLRRVVAADGKSRAFVNDEAASVGLLRELGDSLVEIQGQGEQRGLLDPATHRALLDDARDRAQGLLDGALAAAERAATETSEALAALADAAQALELDPRALEEVEERLFALRALARKHGVAIADLPRLRAEFATRLAGIETGAEHLAALEEEVAAGRLGLVAPPRGGARRPGPPARRAP